MSTIYAMITLTLIFSTPIVVTALGGLFSERSGVINIGLEGLMMFGAFASATSMYFLSGKSAINPYLALLFGMLAGGLVSLLHAYLSVTLKSNQVISGTAINMFALGMTIYLSQIIFGQQRTMQFGNSFIKTTFKGLNKIPVIGPIFFENIYPTVYIALFLVIITWYVVYKTPFGLRLRATGDNPHAVDSVGISVAKIRYIGVFISGLLSGLGGGMLVLTQDIQYTVMSIHGTGFIALAALIFGKWKPWGVLGASLFFGFSQILKVYSTSLGFLSALPLEFFDCLPYLITILALVIFSSKDVGPKAAGIPYDKGSR